jgi:arsenate reductase
MPKRRVLFVCRDNAAHSQMAEALLRDCAGDDYEVCSAGITTGVVHPLAVDVMADRGIDISDRHAKPLSAFADAEPFDFTITVSEAAGRLCPDFPGMGTRLHWSLPDPPADDRPWEEQMVVLRVVRDAMEAAIRLWLDKPELEKAADTDALLWTS